MRSSTALSCAALVAVLASAGSLAPAAATDPVSPESPVPPSATTGQTGERLLAPRSGAVRFASFNASLNRATPGELVADLRSGTDQQARNVAETVQRSRPDVVLLNEFDYAPRAAELFRSRYLRVAQSGARPIDYPYVYTAPVNTGVPSGYDLDNDVATGGPGDAYGFGAFPGQYGMVVYSRYPIATDQVRTFARFRWQDMPGAMLPDDPETNAPDDWYSAEELADLRLSSKSHWDLPLRIGRRTVHLLASHPTPPTFDGDEDRNGKRNHDEIRFWADYVSGRERSRYVYDDAGRRGGLRPGAAFVIAGDQNADPFDGDSTASAIWQLLDHPRIRDTEPASAGATEAAREQGGANDQHEGPTSQDTADFGDVGSSGPGNLRIDYVLGSRRLRSVDSGVFWPTRSDPLFRLVGEYPFPTSDHRLVYNDLRVR